MISNPAKKNKKNICN